MKKYLEHAPLVNAVIHLTFSEFPSLTSISNDLLNVLHTRMIKEGFPEKIESSLNRVEFNFNSQTNKLKQEKQNLTRYLFRASGEQDIVEVSGTSIILKSTNYKTFPDFYGNFLRILKGCLEEIEGLSGVLLKSVGLRYVDVIVPSNNCKLSDFISQEIIPASLDMVNYEKLLHGVSVKVVETKAGQVLKVHFEELPTNAGKIHKVLPDSLIEHDEKCGLVINGQKDWLDVKNESYGILDVEHTHNFIGSPVFQLEKVEEVLGQLYADTNKVFWGVISEKACDAWGYQETTNVEH